MSFSSEAIRTTPLRAAELNPEKYSFRKFISTIINLLSSEPSSVTDIEADPYGTEAGYYQAVYHTTPNSCLTRIPPIPKTHSYQTQRSAIDEPGEIHY